MSTTQCIFMKNKRKISLLFGGKNMQYLELSFTVNLSMKLLVKVLIGCFEKLGHESLDFSRSLSHSHN